MRTREREREVFLFPVGLQQQVDSNLEVTDRMRYFNKWKSDRTAEGEIYHLTVGGTFVSYFRGNYIKVHSPGVEEK